VRRGRREEKREERLGVLRGTHVPSSNVGRRGGEGGAPGLGAHVPFTLCPLPSISPSPSPLLGFTFFRHLFLFLYFFLAC
jgi:hypothetical protein